MRLSFRNVLHRLHKLSAAPGKELLVKMFVQRSADRHALQNSPQYLSPSPCPRSARAGTHTHTHTHKANHSKVESPPPSRPSEFQASRSTGAGGGPSSFLPGSYLPWTETQASSSTQSHIVLNYAGESITDCTNGLSPKHKHGLIPTSHSI